MINRPEYIVIGRFGRPKGLSGEIYIIPETDFPRRFLELKEIFVADGENRRPLKIESVRIVGDRPIVGIAGITSRESAAAMTNKTVEIPGEQAAELPEDSYYQFDIIDSEVRGTDGTNYGVIEEVLFYPANDIYRIKSKEYGEVLFPVVDRFIIGIDIEKKKIIIDPPAGLFEGRGSQTEAE
ncbi:MAG: ribosome maturation factor RimM [candidate division Zixibacteria bacterium]